MSNRRLALLVALLLIVPVAFYLYVRATAPSPTHRIPVIPLPTCRGHRGPVPDVAFSPDGRYLASAGADSTARVWDPLTGKALHTLRHATPLNCLSYNHDGQYLFTAGADGTITEWQLYSATVKRNWPAHTGAIRALALSSDGQTLASAGDDGIVQLWDLATRQSKGTLTAHTAPVWTLAFSPDGRRLASGSDDHTVRIWDLYDQNQTRTLSHHTATVRGVAFTPDGQWLASAGDDQSVYLTRITTGTAERRLPAAGLGRVRGLAFSPAGHRLAASSRDHHAAGEWWQQTFGHAALGRGITLWIWDVTAGELIASLNDAPDDLNAVAYGGGNGTLVAGAGEDGGVWVWAAGEK